MGPRAPLGAALRCPPRLRPTGLPPALSPALPPSLRLSPPARVSPPPQPPPPPPPGLMHSLARRTPWSPARGNCPARASHSASHTAASRPRRRPPSAGLPGTVVGSWEAGRVRAEGLEERTSSRLNPGLVHVAFRVMPRKDLPSHCSPVEPTPATAQVVFCRIDRDPQATIPALAESSHPVALA